MSSPPVHLRFVTRKTYAQALLQGTTPEPATGTSHAVLGTSNRGYKTTARRMLEDFVVRLVLKKPKNVKVGTLTPNEEQHLTPVLKALKNEEEDALIQNEEQLSTAVVKMPENGDEGTLIQQEEQHSTPVLSPPSSMTISTVPKREFLRFPDLAAELRLKVWGVMLESEDWSRDITTCLNYIELRALSLEERQRVTAKYNNFRLTTQEGLDVPVLLQVNRESREEALRCYELIFHDHFRGKPFYVNFAKDRFVFDSPYTMYPLYNLQFYSLEVPEGEYEPVIPPNVNLADMGADLSELSVFESKIQHLVLGGNVIDNFQSDLNYNYGVMYALKRMLNLKTLTLEAPRGYNGQMKPEDKAIIVEKLEHAWKKAKGEDAVMPKVKFVYRYKMNLIMDAIVAKTGRNGMASHYYAASLYLNQVRSMSV